MSEIDIKTYGFNEKAIKSIIHSVNEDQRTFDFKDKTEFEDTAINYLKVAIDWLVEDPKIKAYPDTIFGPGLKHIAKQIAINMFLLLDLNQSSTIIDTQNNDYRGTSTPSFSKLVINENIRTLLEPYTINEDKPPINGNLVGSI